MNTGTKIVIFLIILIASAIVYLKFLSPTAMNTDTNQNIGEDKSKLIKIVAFGDSLTYGYGVAKDSNYPALLEKKLKDDGYNVEVINRGISGETSSGALERAGVIAAENADIVIFGIGGNDALRVIDVDEVKNNIDKTIKTLKLSSSNPRIYLLEM